MCVCLKAKSFVDSNPIAVTLISETALVCWCLGNVRGRIHSLHSCNMANKHSCSSFELFGLRILTGKKHP